jgi:hypothetical protein
MFATMIVALISVSSIAFGQQNFLKQNLNNAPELPWLTKGEFNVANSQGAVDNVIRTISWVINWVLGLLALVSLIILIYTGVKMLFNSSDDKAIDEWYKTAKNVFIALLFIGGSWLIVQFIFYIVKLFVGA